MFYCCCSYLNKITKIKKYIYISFSPDIHNQATKLKVYLLTNKSIANQSQINHSVILQTLLLANNPSANNTIANNPLPNKPIFNNNTGLLSAN